MTQQSPFHCLHPETALRWRTRSNGVIVPVYQCLSCGAVTRQPKKTAPEALADTERVPYDNELREGWIAALHEHRRSGTASEAAQAPIQDHQTRWWAWYAKYLKSPEWKARRAAVLERDEVMCRRCYAPAYQVHHLTYKNVGNEPLEDLIALCGACHTAIHDRTE